MPGSLANTIRITAFGDDSLDNRRRERRERFVVPRYPDEAFDIWPLAHRSWVSMLEPYRQELRFFPLEADATLFHQGMPMTGVHFLYEGKVKAEYTLQAGKKTLLNIVWPVCLIDPCISELHQTSAIALEKSTIATVPAQAYHDWLQRNPELLVAHLLQACDYTSWLQRRLAACAHLGVRDRLLMALLDFQEPFQSPRQSDQAEIQLTGEEIGTMVGTSRETVVRELGMLKQRGLIHVEHSRITVKSVAALREYLRKRHRL